METPKDWQKEVFEKYPSLHKAITGAKMNIFGTKNTQNDLVKLLDIKSQLKSDKEELIEMLEEIKRRIEIINSEPDGVIRETMIDMLPIGIESLIQKHKQ